MQNVLVLKQECYLIAGDFLQHVAGFLGQMCVYTHLSFLSEGKFCVENPVRARLQPGFL